jgi:hypothetical protein
MPHRPSNMNQGLFCLQMPVGVIQETTPAPDPNTVDKNFMPCGLESIGQKPHRKVQKQSKLWEQNTSTFKVVINTVSSNLPASNMPQNDIQLQDQQDLQIVKLLAPICIPQEGGCFLICNHHVHSHTAVKDPSWSTPPASSSSLIADLYQHPRPAF